MIRDRRRRMENQTMNGEQKNIDGHSHNDHFNLHRKLKQKHIELIFVGKIKIQNTS